MFTAAEAAKSILHSFNIARKQARRSQIPFLDIEAKSKASKERRWFGESPMTSTVPLCMQLPIEFPTEEPQPPVKTMN